METIGFLDLLGLRGLGRADGLKLVRHQDRRYDMHDLLRRGWFETYQAFQSKPVFHSASRIAAFIGWEARRAQLVGVYAVRGYRRGRAGVIPVGCPFVEWRKNAFFYDLRRLPEADVFANRVVIDWGASARAWHQKARNKPVTEILPVGQFLAPFSDYLDFTLTFGELKYLVAHPHANREWQARLAAVSGVYLILDSLTGHQYVGAAYGEHGFWGRWRMYAATGHGGNQKLRSLMRSQGYPDALTFSILQVMPRTTARAELMKMERRFKNKLGSRATGLNAN